MASASATIPVGYKQTEIGVIPEDWMVGNLDRFIQAIDCKHITPKFVQLGIPLASIGEVKGRFIDLSSANHTTSEFYNILTGGGRKPIAGDLILSRNATVGEVSQVAAVGPIFAMGQDVVLLRKRSDDFSSSFIQEVLESFIVRLQLENCMVGSTFRRVNVKQIKGLIIPLPNTASEQNMISKVLTDTNIFIEQLEEYIDKKRHIKQGVMQELLTGKTRLPGFTGEWVEKTLEDITICLDNLRIPLNEKQRNDMKGDYPYCGANGIVDFIDQYAIDDDIILMAEDGGYFDKYAVRPIAYRITGKCWVNNHAHILKSRTGYNQGFIFYSLVHKNILRYIASGTRAKLNKSEMNKIEVFLPKEKLEQEAIAEVLTDMDAEIAALEQRLEKTKAIKQGMIQQLLTGRIRLVDPSTPTEASA